MVKGFTLESAFTCNIEPKTPLINLNTKYVASFFEAVVIIYGIVSLLL